MLRRYFIKELHQNIHDHPKGRGRIEMYLLKVENFTKLWNGQASKRLSTFHNKNPGM